MNTGQRKGGSSPHERRPLLVAPGLTPIGPNMFRPITPAPMFSIDSSNTRVLPFTSPPCLPWDWRQAASGTTQSCEPLAALAERALLTLVRAGDETVQ